MSKVHSPASTAPALPDDVVLRVRHVSKKFCRNLKRSMWYGIQDLSRNLVGRTQGKTLDSRPWTLDSEGRGETLDVRPWTLDHGDSRKTEDPKSLKSKVYSPESIPSSPKSSPDGLRPSEFWALRDISFELRRGEVLGLIGPNGCGKTTLLRLIAGIFPPDAGEIAIRGRVGALIALGTGFHPHMTGRENVYLNASILGMRRPEIEARAQDIIDFAEIGEFIDAPVSTYSSGMRVKLGFAVATATQPDLLLIDEILAVGDVGFQSKCFNILNKKLRNSAVVFVSHSMPQVARVASEIIVLNQGRIHCRTPDVALGIEHYYDYFKPEEATLTGSGKAFIEHIQIYTNEADVEHDIAQVAYGTDLWIDMRYRLADEVAECSIVLAIFDKSLRIVAQSLSKASGKYFTNTRRLMTIKVRLPRLALVPGNYSLTVGFTSRAKSNDWGEHLARYEAVKSFKVTGLAALSSSSGPVVFEADWTEMK